MTDWIQINLTAKFAKFDCLFRLSVLPEKILNNAAKFSKRAKFETE